MKVVKSERLAKLIDVKHDDILAMLCLIVMKHPSSVKEFIIKENNIYITSTGLELIIVFMLELQGVTKLIDLVKSMNRED